MDDMKKPRQLELGEYIKQGEPDRAHKAESWQTAIGLQQVDGLEVSDQSKLVRFVTTTSPSANGS